MRRPVTVCVPSCPCLHRGPPQAPRNRRQHALASMARLGHARRPDDGACPRGNLTPAPHPKTWRDCCSGTTRSSISGLAADPPRRARLTARPLRLQHRGSQLRRHPAYAQISGPRRRDVRRAVEREPLVGNTCVRGMIPEEGVVIRL